MKPEYDRAFDTAWRWFSRYVRIKDATVNGNDAYTQCYTTKKWYDVLDLHAGHFQTQGGHNATVFDTDNVRPQSIYANKFLHGMRLEFGDYLKKEIGQKRFDALILRSNQYKKWSIPELRAIAKEYRIKVREIEKELGVKVW